MKNRDRSEYNAHMISVSNQELYDKIDHIFANTSRDRFLTRTEIIRELLWIGIAELEARLQQKEIKPLDQREAL